VEQLTIVTFISKHEMPNQFLYTLVSDLRTSVKIVKMMVYTDNGPNDDIVPNSDLSVIVSPNTTKYMRILHSLNNAETSGILYIDNDITPDNANVLKFIAGIGDNIDLAWGYIGVSENRGFASRLVEIDKLLSHKIIRPLLWNLHIGISVPGQVFFMKKEKFSRDLPRFDTVFDDLTIGICAKQNGYSIARVSSYLGYERPSLTLPILVRQRIRWAKGFYQSMVNNKHNDMFPYVLIHGFMYHGLWLPVWAGIGAVCFFSLPVAIVLYLILCAGICGRKLYLAGYAFAYFLVFPFIHSIWFAALFSNATRRSNS
jgi:cellulose synthase/poly-beta-1,6-N-acetylglucosamine synthase-like glycosyltransferase